MSGDPRPVSIDPDTFGALLSPAGRQLLAEAGAAYTDAGALQLSTRLRRTHPPDLVAAALTQVALRRRARAKFGADADRMYFTRPGLEQATPGPVAAHRARRIVERLTGNAGPAGIGGPGRAGSGPVVDLACGIGGDLIALARAGLVATGVDVDPVTARIASANLAALDLAGPSAMVEVADATTYDRSGCAAAIADPARRDAAGRVFDPDAYAPPWSFVRELLAGDAVVKTAPIIPHEQIPDGVEAEWVSLDGEVKEAALWSGRLRTGADRRATVLRTGPNGPSGSGDRDDRDTTLTDTDDPGEAAVGRPLTHLYEPDGAVIRAGLVTAVAPLIGGVLLDPHIAYLTSDRLVETPFATPYVITDVLPYDLKLLKRMLRDRATGTLTVKRRGLDLDPEALRRRLVAKGPNRATLVLTRTPNGAIALLVEPVPRTPSP